MSREIINALPLNKYLRGMKGVAFLVLIVLCTLTDTQAQLRRFPVQRITGAVPATKTKHTAARTKQITPLILPFWDDFHKSFRQLYPDTALWENSFSVWINDGMAINSPTINAATFDGLDSAGRAYNPNEVMVNGFTDSLVSRHIDLSENEVPIAERSSVYFSFYYQWQGNGEAPDPADYLQLEFKNNANQWEKILTIKPKENFRRDVFYDTIIAVADAKFFHPSFQFRFKSFGRQAGPYDTWNLDYVYLNKNRTINDLSFPDRAAASAISPLFKPYAAIPLSHFLASGELDSVRFDVQNLKNFPSSTNYRAVAKYVNYVNGTAQTYSKTLISSAGVKGATGDMLEYERVRVKLSNLPDVSNPLEFNPGAESLDITLKMKVISNDSTDANRFAFAPINLQVNDTISATYRLRDYYAYDDGHAEYAAGLIEAGNLLAYEFQLQGLTQDTLIGFDIYFPPYGITSNQTVDFTIYQQDPENPEFPAGDREDILLNIPSVPIQNKGIDTFQRVKFLPAILIDKPKFYIGWKEPVAGNLLVGLDISNDTGDRMFVNTNGFWYQNNNVVGSLMIRPVFGSGIVDVKVGVEEELKISIYPNPSNGKFLIDGKVDRIEILSLAGQKIAHSKEEMDGKTAVQLNQPPGLYILRCASGKAVKTYKIIVNR